MKRMNLAIINRVQQIRNVELERPFLADVVFTHQIECPVSGDASEWRRILRKAGALIFAAAPDVEATAEPVFCEKLSEFLGVFGSEELTGAAPVAVFVTLPSR